MKHLFVINPLAGNVKGQQKEIINMIDSFFENYKNIEYHIHVTRWSRDTVGFVRRFLLNEKEIVRIYAVGGSGTLFETINGSIGMPNVQIACYPLGYTNSFIRYFGDDKKHLFLSLRNLVFSETIPIDVIRCGRHYAVSFSAIGLESGSTRDIHMINKNKQNAKGYLFRELLSLKKFVSNHQQYTITPIGGGDSSELNEVFVSGYMLMPSNKKATDLTALVVANAPYYSKSFATMHAHPNDAMIDIYMTKKRHAWKIVSTNLTGSHQKLSDHLSHFSGTSLKVVSDTVMCISIDGELFFETSIDYQIIPYAIDFVCPRGIDIASIYESIND